MNRQPHSFERLIIQAIHVVFDGDEHLIYFLFHHKELKLRLPVDELLTEAQGLSQSDFLLIQFAVDLWCGEGGVSLPRLIEVLDDDVFLRLLFALGVRREITSSFESWPSC